MALALTSAGIVLTADIPDEILLLCARSLHIPLTTAWGKIANLLILRPIPLVLLALGWFYLWAYLRYTPKLANAPEMAHSGNGLTVVTDGGV